MNFFWEKNVQTSWLMNEQYISCLLKSGPSLLKSANILSIYLQELEFWIHMLYFQKLW